MDTTISLKERIFSSGNDWTGLIIRVTTGLVIFPHGAQKLLGWFGGFGFEGTMGFFTGTVGLPWIVGFAVIILEFFGALALIAGFASRVMAISMIGLMTGIVFTSHLSHGFFMNWMGNQSGEGIEYFILVIGLALATVINGGGKYSIDKLIAK